MTGAPDRVWRVFPWDSRASEGDPFSVSYQPAGQGTGRFDRQGQPAGVLYTAETPAHAVAERIQHLRGQLFDDADLIVGGHRLALASMTLPAGLRDGLADLCDPRVLVRLRVGPDETASRHRLTTQRISAAVHDSGHTGLRWWSAFFGDWHAVVLFRDRLDAPLTWSVPEPLASGHDQLDEAASLLGIVIAAGAGPRRRGRQMKRLRR